LLPAGLQSGGRPEAGRRGARRDAGAGAGGCSSSRGCNDWRAQDRLSGGVFGFKRMPCRAASLVLQGPTKHGGRNEGGRKAGPSDRLFFHELAKAQGRVIPKAKGMAAWRRGGSRRGPRPVARARRSLLGGRGARHKETAGGSAAGGAGTGAVAYSASTRGSGAAAKGRACARGGPGSGPATEAARRGNRCEVVSLRGHHSKRPGPAGREALAGRAEHICVGATQP
jgi:hypothetical protein